jgi:thiol-disulfide isomerase/thioredoxin
MKNIALTLIVALSLFGCSGQQAANAPNGKPATPSASDGKKTAPDFELTKVAGGSLKSAELRGKVTVVDFWATWCTECIPEIPVYNGLQEKYAGKDVQIVGITMESGSLDEIKPKVAEFKVNYPVLVGDDKVVEGFGGLIGYPTTFLISKDGTIYKRYLGAPPGKKEALEKDIDNLLAQPAPPVD